MRPVIVLNGGSSSGKTSIARCLQRLLGPTWMTLGTDDLVRALPGGDEVDDLIRAQQDGDGPVGTEGSIEFGPDGSVIVGDDFRRAEACWYAGVAAMGRCGTGLILDEVSEAGLDQAGLVGGEAAVVLPLLHLTGRPVAAQVSDPPGRADVSWDAGPGELTVSLGPAPAARLIQLTT